MNYTMEAMPRQGRIEAGPRKRQIRNATDLTQHPAFGRSVGAFSIGGNPVSRFTYTSLTGQEVVLRFNDLWLAKCLSQGIETQFAHQAPSNIIDTLEDWLLTVEIEVTF